MKRYAIVGAGTKQIIGCTTDEGIMDVLSEEPSGTRFIELTKDEWQAFDSWESDVNNPIHLAIMARGRLRAEVVKTVVLIEDLT